MNKSKPKFNQGKLIIDIDKFTELNEFVKYLRLFEKEALVTDMSLVSDLGHLGIIFS